MPGRQCVRPNEAEAALLYPGPGNQWHGRQHAIGTPTVNEVDTEAAYSMVGRIGNKIRSSQEAFSRFQPRDQSPHEDIFSTQYAVSITLFPRYTLTFT